MVVLETVIPGSLAARTIIGGMGEGDHVGNGPRIMIMNPGDCDSKAEEIDQIGDGSWY